MKNLKPEWHTNQPDSERKVFSQILKSIRGSCPYSGKEAEEWFLYAQIVAPFMVSFVEWILESARQDDVKKLYFLARDGQILEKIASKLKTSGATDIDCRYLLASRQALHLPGHIDISQSKGWILEDTEYLSIATIAHRLQIEPIALSNALGVTNKLPPDRNMTPLERSEISNLIENPAALQLIDHSARQAFDVASGYFRQEGVICDSGMPIGLVDVGWHGRLQRSIENILKKSNLPSTQIHGYYLALNDHLVFHGADARRLKAFMYAPDGPRDGKWILDYVEMIELLHTADHASVKAYVKNEDGRYGAELLPRCLNNGAGFRQSAILAFTDEYAKIRIQQGRSIAFPGTKERMKHFLRWPKRSEAELFIKYEHSEHQDEQRASPYVVPHIPFKYVIHGPVSNIHGRWPEGSHALNCTLLAYRLLRQLVQVKRAMIRQKWPQ